jgi:hypothetical protein
MTSVKEAVYLHFKQSLGMLFPFHPSLKRLSVVSCLKRSFVRYSPAFIEPRSFMIYQAFESR